MTLREKIEVMQAFERGEEIELLNSAKEWKTIIGKNPEFRWEGDNYRIKSKKQIVTIEKWLCKSAWDNYFIIEGEKEFFKTGGYDKSQVKLLSTREVEIDSH